MLRKCECNFLAGRWTAYDEVIVSVYQNAYLRIPRDGDQRSEVSAITIPK